MANELTLSFGLQFSKSNMNCSASKSGLQVTVAGTNYIQNVQSIGTSNEAVVVGDTVPGCVAIINTDATNYVEIFSDNGNANLISKLFPGHFCVVHLASVTLYARANTAAVEIQVTAIDL